MEGAITLDDHDRPVVNADFCDGCGRCEEVCPSASLRAYNPGVEAKGIVVVSRASVAGRESGAISSAELTAGRRVSVSDPRAPHSLGQHPDGPHAMRDAGAVRSSVATSSQKGGFRENA